MDDKLELKQHIGFFGAVALVIGEIIGNYDMPNL